MIKVLYIIDTLETGGAERSLVEITSQFKDINPVFVQIYPGSSLIGSLKKNNIEVHNLGIPEGYHFKSALNALRPLVDKIQPDLIHTTLFKSDIVGRKLKKYYQVPLVSSLVNNSYIKERYKTLTLISKLKLFLVQRYDQYTSQKVDLFISNSKAIKNTNSIALSIPKEKIEVIHRGRDLKKFKDLPKSELDRLKGDLGITNKTVFLNVSRLLERKGQLDLLMAFKSFSKDRPEAILLIAGEGTYRPILEEYISRNDLSGSVKLLGNRSDIPALLAISNYFVFPSWYEGLPGALIEAMMSGTPIIASNIPENLECIDHQSSEIFQKGDVKSLVNSLRNAFNNKDIMNKKADFAKQIAIEKFSISNIAKNYEEVYKSLISET